MVSNNYVDTVIQLAPNMFFGATISTCIIVLKKNKNDNRVCFIDASNEFGHEGNKNKLMPEHVEKIYKAYMGKSEVSHFCHVVTTSEIEEENFNLSVSTYVEQEHNAEIVDIAELNKRISEIVAREQELRDDIDNIVRELEGVLV